ncbi:MAG: hypothetical protein JWQ79_3634 [Mucilaginibacter sp.]|nr:hypothetical protein [Mucilaginibacter sp.]
MYINITAHNTNVFMRIYLKLANIFEPMIKSIEIIRKPRLHLLNFINDLSIEQLNKIPNGFNNNIIWNLGHMIAAQQGVCYKRAGLPTVIDDNFFVTYKPDSKPERFYDSNELKTIEELFVSTLGQLEIDLENNLFVNYTPWTTRYGVELSTIEEAIKFLPFHEGLHLGYIWALRRAVLAS